MSCQIFIDSIRGLNPDPDTQVPTAIRVQGHVTTDSGSTCSDVQITLSLVLGGSFHGEAAIDANGVWSVDLPNPDPQTNARALCGSPFRIAVWCENDDRCRAVNSGQLLCEEICGIEISPLYITGDSVASNIPGFLKISGTAIGCTKVTVYVSGLQPVEADVISGHWEARVANQSPDTGATLYTCDDNVKVSVECAGDEECYTAAELQIKCAPVEEECPIEAELVAWWLNETGQRQFQQSPPPEPPDGTGCHPIGDYVVEVIEPPATGIASYTWYVNDQLQLGETGREFRYTLCPGQTPTILVVIEFEAALGCPDVVDHIDLVGCLPDTPCPNITNVIRVNGCYPGTVKFRAIGTDLSTASSFEWTFRDGTTLSTTTNEVERYYAESPGYAGLEKISVVIPGNENCCDLRTEDFTIQIPWCGEKKPPQNGEDCPWWNPKCWDWEEILCVIIGTLLATAIAAWIVAVGIGLFASLAEELTELLNFLQLGITITAEQVAGVAGGGIGTLLALAIALCGRCKAAFYVIAGAVVGWVASLVLAIYQYMSWVGFGWASGAALLWLAAGLVLRRNCEDN